MTALKLNLARSKKSWRPINGIPGYEMSSDKEVRNSATGKIVAQRKNNNGTLLVSLIIEGFRTSRSVDKIYKDTFVEAQKESIAEVPSIRKHPTSGIALVKLPGVTGYYMGADKKVYKFYANGNVTALRPYNVTKSRPLGTVSLVDDDGKTIRFKIGSNLHILKAIPQPVVKSTPPVKTPVVSQQVQQPALVGPWLKIPGSEYHVRMDEKGVASVRSPNGSIMIPYGSGNYVSVKLNNGKRIQDKPLNFWNATAELNKNPQCEPEQKPVQQSLPLQVAPKAIARFKKPTVEETVAKIKENSQLQIVNGKAVIVPASTEVPKVQAKSILPQQITPKQEVKRTPVAICNSGKLFLVPNGTMFAFKISQISDNVWYQTFKDKDELNYVKNSFDVLSEHLGALTRGKTIATIAKKLGFQKATDLEFSAKFNIVPKRLAYVKKL